MFTDLPSDYPQLKVSTQTPPGLYQPPSPLTTLQDLPRSHHPQNQFGKLRKSWTLVGAHMTTSLWFAHNLWGHMMFVPAPN